MCDTMFLCCAPAAGLCLLYIYQFLQLSDVAVMLPHLGFFGFYDVGHGMSRGYRWLWWFLWQTPTQRRPDAPTHQHRYNDTYTSTARLSLGPSHFECLDFSSLYYYSSAVFLPSRFHSGPFLIAQRRTLRGTLTIFLACIFPQRTATVPPVLSQILSFIRGQVQSCP